MRAGYAIVCLVLSAGCAGSPRAQPPTAGVSLPEGARLIDLTHAFNEETIYWPTSPSAFELEQLHYGPTEAGFFYAANSFSTPEHGGTHLDAPIHFAEGGSTADAVPLERLVAPAIVIDIAGAAAADPNYLLTPEDISGFEERHGTIAPGAIVLIRTGWSERWPDKKRYLGDDTPGDASDLHFPGIGEDAARVLVERRVAAAGIDTASIDHGPSRDFKAHRILMTADIPAFENVTKLDQLPPLGAFVIALPMKIEGGSGGPLRIVAILPPSKPSAQ